MRSRRAHASLANGRGECREHLPVTQMQCHVMTCRSKCDAARAGRSRTSTLRWGSRGGGAAQSHADVTPKARSGAAPEGHELRGGETAFRRPPTSTHCNTRWVDTELSATAPFSCTASELFERRAAERRVIGQSWFVVSPPGRVPQETPAAASMAGGAASLVSSGLEGRNNSPNTAPENQ